MIAAHSHSPTLSAMILSSPDAVDAALPSAPATTKITKEGIDALNNYFATCRWPRNHRMPKIMTDGALDSIITKYNLGAKDG